MIKRKVYILSSALCYIRMFDKFPQYEVVNSLDKADLVQYTGGADIASELYGEEPHPDNWPNPERDDREILVFNLARERGIPQAGICRGAQLFCALSGGSLYQDIDNHSIGGTHPCYDIWTEETYPVSSTHHQMMRPTKEHQIIAVAHGPGPISTFKEIVINGKVTAVDEDLADIEVVYFPNTRSLGFQGHPEYSNVRKCTEMYFEYIDKYLFT